MRRVSSFDFRGEVYNLSSLKEGAYFQYAPYGTGGERFPPEYIVTNQGGKLVPTKGFWWDFTLDYEGEIFVEREGGYHYFPLKRLLREIESPSDWDDVSLEELEEAYAEM